MTEDNELEEIRKKKAQTLLGSLDDMDDEERKQAMEFLPWAFRLNHESGFMEILQNEQLVAITVDPRFAEMITDMLNRAQLFQDAYAMGGDDQ